MGNEDPRAELASVAASLRAYLEWQGDTGATGIPRRARSRGSAAATAPSVATRETSSAAVAERASRGAPATAGVAEAASLAAPGQPAAPPEAPATPAATNPTPAARLETAPRALPVIAAEVATCTRCALHEGRTNTVFSRGNPEAALCFVGEAPGADEDAQGLPFVGRAGQLLDKMIQAMGLDPAKDVYVCNIIKCRPPGNRRPEPSEIDACIPFLHEQLAVVKPKAIVAMGNTAVGALLGTKLGITKLRGQWKLYRGATPLMPTYHPSYLIRPSAQQAEAKRQAWEDLQAVMKELGLELPKKK